MKRMTDTEKWDKRSFQNFPAKLKLLWQYICDKCDMSGVWDTNIELAGFQIGEELSLADLKSLGDKVQILPDGKTFIPGFIPFQYGSLSSASKVHSAVLRVLASHSIPYPYPIDRVLSTPKDKEKDKDKVTAKDTGVSESGENRYTPAVKAFHSCHPDCRDVPDMAIINTLRSFPDSKWMKAIELVGRHYAGSQLRKPCGTLENYLNGKPSDKPTSKTRPVNI